MNISGIVVYRQSGKRKCGGIELGYLIRTIGLGLLLLASPAMAKSPIVAKVDISAQTMDIFVNGVKQYTFPVSTGKRGYYTPTGSYSPQRIHRMWYSRKYKMTPMPYSIFFKGGYAIHATKEVKRLGRPASHGCVRLANAHAKTLYSLVKKYGLYKTRIIVTR